jgi:tetratricopeptide (TPR) repeat protein
LLSALIVLAAASGSPTPPVPATALTLQQRYDKAMELALSGKCIEAIPLFEGLKSASSFKAGTVAGAMVAVHQGNCLVKAGDEDRGIADLEQGLAVLQQAGHQFDGDIAIALAALGDAAMTRGENARAKARYLQALALTKAGDPMSLNIRLAKATAFDGGPEPLQYVEEAIRIVEASQDATKDQLAALHTLHARILLNQGRNKEAYDELKGALKLSGGLDLKVTLSDIALRSDLAVAAQLSGDLDGAREYLAYTGAGRMPKGRFERALNMSPPVCGNETGLQPDDMAIVQFAIDDNGQVIGATTVYSRGSTEVASAFARAVRAWVWDPESIKTVPAFLRSAVYVELRCTASAQGVPDLLTPLRSRFGSWAADMLKISNKDLPADFKPNITIVDVLKSIIANPGEDRPALRLTAAKGLLALWEPGSPMAHDRALSEALSAAVSAQAPQEVINFLEVEQAVFQLTWARTGAPIPRAEPSRLIALLEKPGIAQDPLASDTLRIKAAAKIYARTRPTQWQDLLKQAAADERLQAHHPLRQLANLALADEAASSHDFAAAQGHFAATGLTEEQCALIGMQPVLQRSGLSSNDFPATAMQYGFEGWVNVEYDIRSDGRTAELRPIIAYPPFIFNSAAVGGLTNSRFQASYRPEGGKACSANRTNIVFLLPR